MYTILGAGGAIADSLSQELSKNNIPYKLVSRSPKAINGVQSISADLTNAGQTLEAVKGSSVVVQCAGLKYDSRVWKTQWPAIMKNTIDACKENNAKLIFFDNVYMLGKVGGHMTEETPYNPISKKGEIRAKVATLLMDEAKAGNLQALIARSADFYGPSCKTSVLNLLVFDKMAKGKKAQWMIDDKEVHSFTFTPDCGKALLLLSQNESAWNQIWNMPTASPALTGKQLICIAAKIFNVPQKHTLISKGMIGTLGVFMRTMYEMKEMLYQYDSEYIFDSSKFDNTFNFKPTSYKEGFEITAQSYNLK
ncbi:MAG: NAD-dependent epimerase/dehydratase family protein [Bacteroidota bacterium]|nr:NAD-dependent epimerase/dehydratase family protein [Bacteroidota bacterium]